MEIGIDFGRMNGHAIGRILKEAVRRAMVVIREERHIFEATTKEGYGGTMNDVFTSADLKAQAVYERTFDECFPDYGIIGEERLVKPASNGCTHYFTVDPLDGTKAYVRRQSHGVATMVALVAEGEVISAYIGDVCANEVYGFRPNSSRVHRITHLDSFQEMNYDGAIELKDSHALLRDPLDRYASNESRRLVTSIFKNYEVMGSSIGTWMARLWKREVVAALIPGRHETPWDSTPILGISKKLGYVFARPAYGGWEQYEPKLLLEPYLCSHDTLVIHKSDFAKL